MPTTRSVTYASQVTHVGNGGALASGAMSAATDVSTALGTTNLLQYDRADVAVFVSATAAVSSTANTLLLYRRDINIDGTNDEPPPATTPAGSVWRQHLCGVITMPPFTAAGASYYLLSDVPLTKECEFYLENTLNTGVAAGWTIKVTPKTDSFA